jgi:UDP-N-acetylmuramate-alanine ligase
VAGREEGDDQNVSSLDLVNDIKQGRHVSRRRHSVMSPVEEIFYAKDLEETRKLIDKNIKPDDILLIMGAGDIYKVADKIVK